MSIKLLEKIFTNPQSDNLDSLYKALLPNVAQVPHFVRGKDTYNGTEISIAGQVVAAHGLVHANAEEKNHRKLNRNNIVPIKDNFDHILIFEDDDMGNLIPRGRRVRRPKGVGIREKRRFHSKVISSTKETPVKRDAIPYAVEISDTKSPLDYIDAVEKGAWLCLDISEGKFNVDTAIKWIKLSRELEKENKVYRPKQVVMANFRSLEPEDRNQADVFFTDNNTYFRRYTKGKGFDDSFDDIVREVKKRNK